MLQYLTAKYMAHGGCGFDSHSHSVCTQISCHTMDGFFEEVIVILHLFLKSEKGHSEISASFRLS